ncbi:MAG: Crp/Fnr family transcriptional regulator, partial [Pseudomonadota bacterium]|nr:Crp/Fnr family transcriptional regulator [Pseudomonadota bacterium]
MADPENHLIEILPRKDRLRLLAACEPVELVYADILCEPAQVTRHVYFPVDGFISLLTPTVGRARLEAGLVGREGMLGIQLVLGVDSVPLHAVVQGPGKAWRIRNRAFRGELEQSSALRRGLQRYAYVVMMQLAASAACARFHQIGPRLARRLLMSHDRA